MSIEVKDFVVLVDGQTSYLMSRKLSEMTGICRKLPQNSFFSEQMASFHPSGVTLEIVGLESNTQGRSCEMHATCGCLVKEDVVLRLRKVQVVVEGMEESAIAAYHVSDGVDTCRVGFLKRHLVKHSKQYEGALVQVTEVYSGLSESPTKRRLFHLAVANVLLLPHCLKNRGCKKGLWKTVMTLICHQNELKRNGYIIHYNLGINCSFFRKPCIITMSP